MTSKFMIRTGDLVNIYDDNSVQPSLLTVMKDSYGIGLVTKIYESYYWVAEERKSQSVSYAEVYFFSVEKKITLDTKNLIRAY